MDVVSFLAALKHRPGYCGQLAHVEELPARAGRFASPSPPLPPLLVELLAAAGVEQLYTHQVEALEYARAGRDLVVTTGTASGKSLCYHVPILEALLAEPDARALYLFPTKALAQDQLKGLLSLVSPVDEAARRFRPGVYDGDTPTAQRRRIKAEANLVLSNPDMLHASILPYHPKWARFFGNLRYVVVDEAHMYRGILGAHVACVLRRLQRVCEHYGARPVFLAASATIANPAELVAGLIGRDVAVVSDDGSPRGRKFFALWNPAPLGDDSLARRSATDDAVELMVAAIEHDAQVLAFTRTRQQAELVHRYAQQRLEAMAHPAAKQVASYRGGYLPLERRQIEQDLFAGRLKAVAATNALELGIDVGSLDVTLLVGYPGTIASTWQQAGRAGRRHGESLAVLLAGNDPIDQYLTRHPEHFFGMPAEHAVVDPENPYVLARQLAAAAFELPLDEGDSQRFGPLCRTLAGLLHDARELNELDGRFYYAGGRNPAVEISLRHMSDNTFSIVQVDTWPVPGGPPPLGGTRPGTTRPSHEVIANVDAISAPELIYPEAVYLHRGETYLVRQLDLQGKIAYVERVETDYYTQAVVESSVRITQPQESRETAWPGGQWGLGDVDVTWQTVAFKKIKFGTRENIGMGPVDIPAQTLNTTACWLAPGEAAKLHVKGHGLLLSEGLVGVKNLAIVALPLVAMCDPRDIGGVVDSKNLGHSTMILYDRYPGGLGYCAKGYQHLRELLEICRQIVGGCTCKDGCPSCVGLPNHRPAIHSDPDLSRGYPVPNKQAATILLDFLLEHLPEEGAMPATETAARPPAPHAAWNAAAQTQVRP